VGPWSTMLTAFNGAGLFILTPSQGLMQLISGKITNLVNTLNPTPFQPTQCPCDIFGQRWMLFNGTFTDPWGISRSMLLCWNGSIWTIASQRYSLTNIAYYEQNSTIKAYGTDGSVLVQLFAQPDQLLQKRIATKQYMGANYLLIKNWKRVYVQMQDNSGAPGGVSLVGMVSTAGGGIPNGTETVAFDLPPGQFDVVPHPIFGAGLALWADLNSYSEDFTVERIAMTLDERTLFGA
jgi:hypothetical protein